jgi:hypothetical protein
VSANSTYGTTRSQVVAQIASMMDPTLAKNEGFVDSIELTVPKGCCLNPHDNKPVAAGARHPGVEVGEAIAKALGAVLPERSCPQIDKSGMPTVVLGMNPVTGKMFIDHSPDTFAAHCGAVKGRDGWGAMNASFGNVPRATAELSESIFPIRQMASDYATDTRWRKGIVEMTPDVEGAPKVGTHVREVLRLAGKSYTTDTTVTDTGPGIPDEEIPVVLASFGQGSNSIKSAEQGAGLGLPIAKNLIDLQAAPSRLSRSCASALRSSSPSRRSG